MLGVDICRISELWSRLTVGTNATLTEIDRTEVELSLSQSITADMVEMTVQSMPNANASTILSRIGGKILDFQVKVVQEEMLMQQLKLKNVYASVGYEQRKKRKLTENVLALTEREYAMNEHLFTQLQEVAEGTFHEKQEMKEVESVLRPPAVVE